jgi:hypothetical protein
MPITEDQRNLIRDDLITAFQLRFGDEWPYKMTTNLRPSPISAIAQERQVSVSEVRKIRSQLLRLGIFFSAMKQANEQLSAQES